ncbi:hypothetical protein [Pseudomonas sp. NBRC 111134]|uniref:hypothetical protein n=1 Tax=Pseudomonas sp. NBRC 111134 TaxID=1661049 RepID=UPI000761F63D|nr:hypothetical protein [Pseudomonas sp. NBRC 111134]
MHQVFINDDAEVEIDELLDLLKAHRIVVLNAVMRTTARDIQKRASEAIKDYRGEGPHVHLFEFEVLMNTERWSMPTFTHSTRNQLDIEQTHRIVDRATRIWVDRGMSNHFLYTNNAEVDDKDDDD